jgi:hypothetical protein
VFPFSRLNLLGVLTLASSILMFSPNLAAQAAAGASPEARTQRQDGDFRESWTTPTLDGSRLVPLRPVAFITDNPHYTAELQQVEWRPGDPIDLYVIRPKGIKKPPVILYLYGYPTDSEVFRRADYQELVTRDGCAAVGFVSALTGHRYHDRPMKQWFLSELQETLATSAHDVQMVLNYLASRDDLDLSRVGMFAQGSGASIAILTAAVDARIKVLEALDPWGDWPVWLATSRFVPEQERPDYEKPEFLERVAGLEPVEWLPRIQSKKFRLDDELFDTVTPKEAREKIRAAAPAGSEVMLYKSMEEFKAAFQDGKNLQWIRRALQSLP